MGREYHNYNDHYQPAANKTHSKKVIIREWLIIVIIVAVSTDLFLKIDCIVLERVSQNRVVTLHQLVPCVEFRPDPVVIKRTGVVDDR